MVESWYLQPILHSNDSGSIIQPPNLDEDELTRWRREGLTRLANGSLAIWRKRLGTRLSWYDMLEPDEWGYHCYA